MPLFFLIWMAPMAALAAFDFRSARRIHAVTALGSVVMAVAFWRVLLVESEWWLAIGRPLLKPFL